MDSSGPDTAKATDTLDQATPPVVRHAGSKLIPIGKDPDGCIMYRVRISKRPGMLAITYRTPDGRWTLDRRDSDCPVAKG